MTQEELTQFLKENLKIKFDTHRESYREYPCIILQLGEQEICKAVNYDMEINYE